MNLSIVFENAVSRCPKKVALIEGDRQYTYGELEEHVWRVASAFQRLGIRQRDRVMVLLKNRIETVVIFFALQKIGAVFAPVNPYMSFEIIKYCANDLEAKVIIYEGDGQNWIKKIMFNDRPILISLEDDSHSDLTYQELINYKREHFEEPIISDDDIALILYTSGVTGTPKGVPRSHMNEYSSTIAHIFQTRLDMGEVCLGAVPFYHTMGMRVLLSTIMLAGKLVILSDFDPIDALKSISKEKVTSLYLTPTMYHDIIHCSKLGDYELSSVNKLAYAGAKMTKALTDKCFSTFNPKHFVNHYGSTEIYTYTTCSELNEKPESAGKPGIHQNIRVVRADPFGNATIDDLVQPEEVGEIIVNMNSPEAFKGYWNRPDLTKKAIRNNWFFTGDLGFFDQAGDLYVLGRIDDMIISAGENIYPMEVEEVLTQHPQVADCAVIGEPHERWGQIVVALIVPKEPGLNAQELDRFCMQHEKLPNFKRPRKYIFVPEIKRTVTGKVLRNQTLQHEA
ncbi:4-chlorobenzoyl CoA ligase (plasmid) [Geobacillus kaustophilus HTA426]|uniref:4-chlorobenzoyl CoA ligase n=1 Tax=Geobacillus kaustophilus (strain HTA426) TaxID=235909 RepID=Q5QL42_GEOKA|nr:class I adenylate-forming enzyme family protein [Geobacillus kaustophilus]BAD74268.1 4-chlorobenzoyl CoA ligase [Geobacillus kaustophilus HTA426]